MKHKLIMENWRKFRDSSELINEGREHKWAPKLLRISPNFKSQGTLSRLKNRFTGKKGDTSFDEETGLSKLESGNEDHLFQFRAVYDTPYHSYEDVPLGSPIDFKLASPPYRGTIASPEDIKKLWNHALDYKGPVAHRHKLARRELIEKYGDGDWEMRFGYVKPNGLIDETIYYLGSADVQDAKEYLKNPGEFTNLPAKKPKKEQ
jgi:hypothetical protein